MDFDTVVVGGGQAGLAVAYELRRAGRRFVVLDAAARVGDAWRRRWDSLRLFTPAGADGLPGAPFPAPARYRPTKDEMADFVEWYAARFELPVRSSVRVGTVRRAGDRFDVVAGGTSTAAGRVIVATGACSVPRQPAFHAEIGVAQLHSSEYLRPSQVAAGAVLVAGAGNSGAEIALELARTHRVWLAGRDTGRLPHVGASSFRLLTRVRTDRGPGRSIAGRLTGTGAPLVGTRSTGLAAAGVRRVPPVVGVTAGLPRLADGRVLEVATVVWCTGFRQDVSWLPSGACDAAGAPVHDRGIARHVPGIAFAGLRYQTTLASGILAGAAGDAGYVVSRVRRPD